MSAIVASIEQQLAHCEAHLPGYKAEGDSAGWALCEGHGDQKPSLHILANDKGGWVTCHVCVTNMALYDYLKTYNYPPLPFTPEAKPEPKAAPKPAKSKRYTYPGLTGNALRVTRKDLPDGTKKFLQQRWENGQWAWGGLKSTPLYNTHILKDPKTDRSLVFIVEGEKNADLGQGVGNPGFIATTAPEGSGNFKKVGSEYLELLRPFAMRAILPDNDRAGYEHALQVGTILAKAGMDSQVLLLPGLTTKGGDLYDWLPDHRDANPLFAAMTEAMPFSEFKKRFTELTSAFGADDSATAGKGAGKKKRAASADDDDDDEMRCQAEKLFGLAKPWTYVVHEGQPYAIITRENDDGTTRKDAVRFSRGGVRQALTLAYWKKYRACPCSDTLKQVYDTLEARATFEGAQATVWIRTAAANGCIYLDLCDELGRVVEITKKGWTITQNPPVYFQRTLKMLAIPVPQHGGSINDLRPFINTDDASFTLIVAWLLYAYFPLYSHPILLLEGIEGSAKTTTAKALRDLVDPNGIGLRKAPRDGEDIAVAATNNWIVGFDNVSESIEKLSDEFCGLATGSGHARRAHYSNDEENSYSYLRPSLLTGLPGLMGPPDFVSRTLKAVLPVISEEGRLLESELFEDKGWTVARPRILGAFLDAVACALANHGKKRLAKLPRLAEFAQTVVNAEDALPWPSGQFMRVFTASRLGQVEHVLEGDSLAVAIRNLLATESSYEDGATDFIKHLATKTNDHGKTLPHPTKLPTHLRRLENSLRQVGIGIRFRKTNGEKKVAVYVMEKHNFTPPLGVSDKIPTLPTLNDASPHNGAVSSGSVAPNQPTLNRPCRPSTDPVSTQATPVEGLGKLGKDAAETEVLRRIEDANGSLCGESGEL